MSKRKSSKRESRPQEELLEALSEQVRFITLSAAAYDKGDWSEAKRIAVHIRLLVHESRTSSALLRQLGVIDALGFVDGAEVPNPRNLLPTSGLTGLHIRSSSTGMNAEWVPKFAMPGYPLRAHRAFIDWWNRVVVIDSQQNRFSRKDLVLVMANQDGGAHFDPYLDAAYRKLTRENSIGWAVTGPGGSRPLRGIEYASVRQIAWELLDTLSERAPLDPA